MWGEAAGEMRTLCGDGCVQAGLAGTAGPWGVVLREVVKSSAGVMGEERQFLNL